MLCHLKRLHGVLVSPDDAAPITLTFDDEDRLISCTTTNRTFQIQRGTPFLLKRSSVITCEDGILEPSRRKRHPCLRAVSRFVHGSNKVAARNALTFLDHLKRRTERPLILVVGAGLIGDGSEPLYEARDVDVVAFDVYATAHVQFVADAHDMPLASGSVDGVWIQAVLEHVVDPEKVASEIHRVLKPEGMLYAETPFMQQVHEGPFDFQRFSESGHRWLFRRFEVVDSGVVWGPGWTLQWSIRYFMWALTRSRTLGLILSAPFMFVRWLDRFIPRQHASDGASSLFFLGVKSDASISQQELIAFYRGSQKRA